jgi:hypothetical protein
MNNNVSINLTNGLGDKFLDLIGFYILCNYLNYKPCINFDNNGKFLWGNNNYDLRLFNFSDITISDNICNYYVNAPNPSTCLCPYKVYKYVKEYFHEITFEQISKDFAIYSQKIIKPSDIILSKIPNNIEQTYGIHLRKTDKINNGGNLCHENSIDEFNFIIQKLLEDVESIIDIEYEAKFLIVSEDKDWKIEILNQIMDISKKKNKTVIIINIDYTNEHNYSNYISVLDMFCLSKCKEILQGVKYSTFSILASLLGNGKLRNYANALDTYPYCLIHLWSSVIDINNKKNMDIEFHKNITTNKIRDIDTNINKKFTDNIILPHSLPINLNLTYR